MKEPEWTADEVGKGWAGIVNPLIEMCKLNNIAILQIKEKFGGLCFYVGREATDAQREQIRDAEDLSCHTCEECGGEGKIGPVEPDGYWLRCLCAPCRAALAENRAIALKKWLEDHKKVNELLGNPNDSENSA